VHSCFECGCACYCGGDIDDCDVGDICRQGCGCEEDDFSDDDFRDDEALSPSVGEAPNGDAVPLSPERKAND
jgi:hypothetical protein